MSTSKPSGIAVRASATEADRMAKAFFDNLAARPTPDHLVELVDELEHARTAGRLRKPAA